MTKEERNELVELTLNGLSSKIRLAVKPVDDSRADNLLKTTSTGGNSVALLPVGKYEFIDLLIFEDPTTGKIYKYVWAKPEGDSIKKVRVNLNAFVQRSHDNTQCNYESELPTNDFEFKQSLKNGFEVTGTIKLKQPKFTQTENGWEVDRDNPVTNTCFTWKFN